MAVEKTIQVEATDAGTRVDVYLARTVPEISRARIQNLLSEGYIFIKNSNVKASYRVLEGDIITLTIPEIKPAQIQAQEQELDILYEDANLVVINKRAGLVVHPGAGHSEGTLVNALLHRYPDMHVGDVQRPGLVHRLDKDTSGVMVCARNDRAFLALTAQFKSREVRKIYRAFCIGRLKKPNLELVTGHARHKTDRKKFTTKLQAPTIHGTGVRVAHSRFETVLYAGGVSELRVELLTGRTHQIRAHLADIQHPLVKDAVYGGASRTTQLPDTPVRQAVLALERHGLHAEFLAFAHPILGKRMQFEAKLPSDLQAIHDAMSVISAHG